MKHSCYLVLAFSFVILPGLSGCAATSGPAEAPLPPSECQAMAGVDRETLMEKARQYGTIAVEARLKTAFRPEGELTPAQVLAQRQAIAAARARVLHDMEGWRVQVVARLVTIPYLTLKVDEEALLRLACHADVAAIRVEKRMLPRSLTSGQ